MSVKIASVQLENVKKVMAVYLEPTANGLTIIGGKNKQGKTSVIDAIAWNLGGAKFEPSDAQRDGAMNPPKIKMTLSNGLTVERSGKGGTLKVTDQTGKRFGQSLLDSFVSTFALDIPRFMAENAKGKARLVLQIMGIENEIAQSTAAEASAYARRTTIGQIAKSKADHAAELPEYADAPVEPVSVSDLLQQHNAVLSANAENQRKRGDIARYEQEQARYDREIADLEKQLAAKRQQAACVSEDLQKAHTSAAALNDQSTESIEAQIADFEAINAKVAANAQKATAHDEAEQYQAQYDALTVEIEGLRTARLALLEGANLPLPELTVEDGNLIYKGKQWDCMSGAEQYQVATAIVRKLNPECGFVLLDKLESMDLETLAEFGGWLKAEGLQAIATRVGTGDECALIIEDGLPKGKTYADVVTLDTTTAADAAAMEDF